MILAALLFLEGVGAQNPSVILRLRNLAFFSALSCAAIFSFIEIIGYVNLVFSPRFLMAPVDTFLTIAQTSLLVVGGLSLAIGLSINYRKTKIDDWVVQTRQWSKLRERLGLARSKLPFVAVHPIVGAGDRLRLAGHSLGLDPLEGDGAYSMMCMICALEPRQNRVLRKEFDLALARQDILKCASLQDTLIKEQGASNTISWSLAPDGSPPLNFDIERDPLHQSLRPALSITNTESALNLKNNPAWVQLGAIATADVGLLNPHKSRPILNGESVDPSILHEYLLIKEP